VVAPLRPIALGNTGISVAKLSLGTVKLGRDQGVKYPTPVHIPDDQEARALLAKARELGINMLDTAPAYGNSELRLGSLLAGQREDWVICTKVGEEFSNGLSHYDFSPEHCRFSVERSLKRLNTDYVDIVLIHSDGNDVDILQHFGTLDALQTMQAEGKIRATGISHKTPAGGALAVRMGVDIIMATLNRNYLEETTLIAAAAEQGCGVLIKKALSSGHGAADDLPWVAAHKGVHSIVVGTTNPAHLEENVRLLQAK
jgi:aryl-alcohol dehydrogenase-like predicted oxidoreductase